MAAPRATYIGQAMHEFNNKWQAEIPARRLLAGSLILLRDGWILSVAGYRLRNKARLRRGSRVAF